jgi:hypothetical protein
MIHAGYIVSRSYIRTEWRFEEDESAVALLRAEHRTVDYGNRVCNQYASDKGGENLRLISYIGTGGAIMHYIRMIN